MFDDCQAAVHYVALSFANHFECKVTALFPYYQSFPFIS